MKKLTRIVTFMGTPEWGTPEQLLTQVGTGTYTLPDKVRLFTVRRVVYDDSMTPLYSEPYGFERTYQSLDELIRAKKITPLLQDCPILDNDHSLKVYNHDEVCTK